MDACANRAVHCVLFSVARMEVFSCVCFILLFAFSTAQSSECGPSPLGYACMKSLADFYNLHWTQQDDLVHIALEGIGAEWVGFSFPEIPGQMEPADAVIGYVDVNGPVVLPYRITMKSVFAEDEDTRVRLDRVSAVQDDDRTVVAYTRSLRQGTVTVRTNRPTDVNFAIGDVDSLRYHRTNRGSATVRLDMGKNTTVPEGLPFGLGNEDGPPQTAPDSPPPSSATDEAAPSPEEDTPEEISVPPSAEPAVEPAEPSLDAEETIGEMLDELL